MKLISLSSQSLRRLRASAAAGDFHLSVRLSTKATTWSERVLVAQFSREENSRQRALDTRDGFRTQIASNANFSRRGKRGIISGSCTSEEDETHGESDRKQK